MRIAFAGFRHGHIKSLYRLAMERDDVEIVAACEKHDATRESLEREGLVKLTHAAYQDMLADVDCDIVAVGNRSAGPRAPVASRPAAPHVDHAGSVADNGPGPSPSARMSSELPPGRFGAVCNRCGRWL